MMITMRQGATQEEIQAVLDKIPPGYKCHIGGSERKLISVEDLNEPPLNRALFTGLPGVETVVGLRVELGPHLKTFALPAHNQGL